MVRHAFGLEVFCSEKMVAEMIRVMQDKAVYFGLVVGDINVVR